MTKAMGCAPARTEEPAGQDEQMLAYLTDLLERQLEKLRKYDLDGAVRLAEESQPISAQIARQKILERPCYAGQKKKIQGLYQDICLVIAAERQEVAEKLRQIREGLKALGAYAGR
ncbi:MAG TPA: hypothetical protein PK054_04530 [Anaerohalosphaeraceae bacterium]|nr:hypothetical protein [Anaerohalosphaeraceae bacterium]HOL87662.1 hypothetical protein [Anaerohalosphaeraceae bacterium]HOQ03825.1 hypothetical protein [Anaerohalosphaeraceae bacterium]HPP55830.1 hypothetical protein [Anaerohalosphaeraceae bacterium]